MQLVGNLPINLKTDICHFLGISIQNPYKFSCILPCGFRLLLRYFAPNQIDSSVGKKYEKQRNFEHRRWL